MTPKEKLPNGTRVRVCRFGDDKENMGTVRGLAFDNITRIYIVELDKPDVWGWEYDCITVPGGCLDIFAPTDGMRQYEEQALQRPPSPFLRSGEPNDLTGLLAGREKK